MTTPGATDPRTPRGRPRPDRVAWAVALVAAVLLIWINGAVGIIGSEDNPLNLVYAGVLAVAAIGSLLVGFEAGGMARVMQFTAATQALVGVVVLALGHFTPVVTAVFMALWLIAAAQFRKGAAGGSRRSAPDGVGNSPFWRRVRWLVWGGAALLLMLPAVAMRYTTEVDWSPFDFIVMGLLLGSVCASFELALRVARSNAYILATGIAAATGFLMVWINLAVGIIGSERNPANVIFFAVLVVALFGVVLAQLQPRGMAKAMQVTAAAQAVTVVVAAVLGDGAVFLLPAIFVAMWLAAAQFVAESIR